MAIGVVSSFLILVLQVHYGVIPKSLTSASFLSIAYPYLGIIVVAFIVSAVRAPYLLDKERQSEIGVLNAEKSKQDELIEKRDGQEAKKARHKELRERLGELFAEGDHIRWGLASFRAGSNSEHTQWLKKVKEFLSKEPEFEAVFTESAAVKFKLHLAVTVPNRAIFTRAAVLVALDLPHAALP